MITHNLEYIACKGNYYTIEWYFDDNGKSQALNYYNQLSTNERIKILKLLKRMSDVGKIINKTLFRNEGDKIYAFKPNPDRFLCFFYEGKKIVTTNAFKKKQQKLPEIEKIKALNNRNDYIVRTQQGNYYDK